MAGGQTATIRTQIPSRLDRLPWAKFHWLIILGLGTAWILDGLEVTIVGAIGSRLTESGSGINMTPGDIGTAAAIYVIGACTGALFFGQLTDRFGRKKLFMITLGVYLIATAATAFAFAPWYFYLARFFTGAGIGGEYAAINSAIDELIPARVRGRIDLIINGSFWVGSILGSLFSLLFLDTAIFPKNLGWRCAFGLGVIIAVAILFVRRAVPESPRWLFIHGYEDEAERLVDQIEQGIEAETGQSLAPVSKTLTVQQRHTISFREIARVAFKVYPRRSILCLALFIGQAFIYNGVTFNLGTLMTTFFGVASGAVPIFTIVYAASNFTGPLTLGRLFDTVGRKPMVSATYLGSAAIAVLLAILFVQPGLLGAWSFIVVVMAVFFLASAGASAAYLTASEIFPMETRALAIAFFYAIGTAAGGIAGPLLFGNLIGSKDRTLVMVAFLIGAGVMTLGGVAELFFGVKAEQTQLEDVAKPLTAAAAEGAPAEGAPAEGAPAEGAPASGVTTAPQADVAASERLAVRRAREEAAWERARAAEHQAVVHDLLAAAAAGDTSAGDRLDAERLLAQIAEIRAQAHDEYAVAHDEYATAEDESDRAVAAAARRRGDAAEQRARAHEEEAAALAAEHEADALRHRELAAAADERARASEQLALARQAAAQIGDVGRGGGDTLRDVRMEVEHARVRMHESWARVHQKRAEAHVHRSSGDDAGAIRAEQEANVLEEQARAAALRVDAAQFRGEAAEEQRDEAAAVQARRQREESAQRDAIDERIRAAIERRLSAERRGLRRYRPGPGRLFGSPGMAEVLPHPEERLGNEIGAIERALREHGATDRDDLARMVGARYWGPGVFREALHAAVAEGIVRRTSRTTYSVDDEG